MTHQDAFGQPGSAERLAGGLSRVGAVSAERLDRDFERAGDSPAKFAVARNMNAGEAGRALVSAGSLSPDDVRVLAMQSEPDRQAIDAMKAPGGLRERAGQVADTLSDMEVGRDGKAALHGMRRSLKSHDGGALKLSHVGVADAFGRIAMAASRSGATEAKDLAASTFASCTQAGVEVARERSLDRDRAGDAR